MTVAQPVRKSIVEWNAYTGRLEAVDFVEIRSRVSGYLQSIHFDEGQIVQKGDLLFVIDPRPFEAELNGAKAALRQAESQLQQAKADVEASKAGISSAEAAIGTAEATVEVRRRASKQLS